MKITLTPPEISALEVLAAQNDRSLRYAATRENWKPLIIADASTWLTLIDHGLVVSIEHEPFFVLSAAGWRELEERDLVAPGWAVRITRKIRASLLTSGCKCGFDAVAITKLIEHEIEVELDHVCDALMAENRSAIASMPGPELVGADQARGLDEVGINRDGGR